MLWLRLQGTSFYQACSASGSLSDRSINLCFAGASPGRACRGIQTLHLSTSSGAAAALQSASLQDTACPTAAAGPILAFKESRGVPQENAHVWVLEDWRLSQIRPLGLA